jgi:predicted nuclease with TOPRIM domain
VSVYPRRIDGEVDDPRTDMVEIKERLGFLQAGYASLSRRVDRLGGDVEQIRQRLDSVDAPPTS